jgi:acetylornithine deacetylase/succinyl-diaminopimelate desuccinylase-like protein
LLTAVRHHELAAHDRREVLAEVLKGNTMIALPRTVVAAMAACVCLSTPALAADPFDAKARSLFERLIALDTSSVGRKVPEAMQLMAAEFRAAGFPDKDITILPLVDSASLVVRFRGIGKAGKPILFLAHMDVVPAKRADWERDPFKLIEENGYFYGRGTSDVKNGVVTIATAFFRLKAEGFMPSRDLIFYVSGDEETAQLTPLDTVRNHRALIDAEYALNSDAGGGTLDETSGAPLHYGMQTAEKTYTDYELTATNPGGHSSRPRPDNAIYDLADALKRLQAHRFPVMWNEATIASLKLAGEKTPGPLGEALRRFADNPSDAEAADVLFNDSAYVGQTRTTCVATMLQGGHAANALPQSATATVNCRVFPGTPLDAVEATLKKLAGDKVAVKRLYDPMWSEASPLRDDVLGAVTRSVQQMYPGVRVVPSQSNGTTDGVVFRSAGIPTYGVSGVFMKNSDDFAHGLNERIPVRALYDDVNHWYRLAKDLAGTRARTR